MHTTRDRKRKVRIFEPSQALNTPLTMPPNNPRFLCRSPPRCPQLLKAALNVFVAEVRTLDGPEDLSGETTAQIGLYSHPCQDGQASSIRPGGLNS